MNNNEEKNSPVNKFTIIICTGSPVILKYAILHLLLKFCTNLGSLVYVRFNINMKCMNAMHHKLIQGYTLSLGVKI